MDVLRSMLVEEVLKVAGSEASVSFPCLASASALNVRLLILSMFPVCSDSWSRLWVGVVIVLGRTSVANHSSLDSGAGQSY